MFLGVIPLGILLTVSIIYNDRVDGFLKLWPLICALSLFILFIFVYFFRAVSISTEEVRAIGLFSSKEIATVKRGRRLVFTIRSKKRLRVELFGKEDKPAFDWMKKGDYGENEIRLFSEKAVGSERSIKRILAYLQVPCEDFKGIFSEDTFEKEYRDIKIYTETEAEEKKISILFLCTI